MFFWYTQGRTLRRILFWEGRIFFSPQTLALSDALPLKKVYLPKKLCVSYRGVPVPRFQPVPVPVPVLGYRRRYRYRYRYLAGTSL